MTRKPTCVLLALLPSAVEEDVGGVSYNLLRSDLVGVGVVESPPFSGIVEFGICSVVSPTQASEMIADGK